MVWMKTPYTTRWIPLDILYALGPEDDDAELRERVSAELDDPVYSKAPPPAYIEPAVRPAWPGPDALGERKPDDSLRPSR